MTASCASFSAALRPAEQAPPAPVVVPADLLTPCEIRRYVFLTGVCTADDPSGCTPCAGASDLAKAERADHIACATRHAELARKLREHNAKTSAQSP